MRIVLSSTGSEFNSVETPKLRGPMWNVRVRGYRCQSNDIYILTVLIRYLYIRVGLAWLMKNTYIHYM